MKQSDPQKHYEWCLMPQVYMATALKLAKDILPPSQEFKEYLYSGDICKSLGITAHSDYYFIYPIIYNFKHAIELWIKCLGNIDHGEFEGSHNLEHLFNLAIQKAQGDNKVLLEELKNNSWSVIEKYFNGTYIPSNTEKDKPDIHNEVERYPEARNNSVYGIPTDYHWIDFDVLSLIISDIEFIYKSLRNAMVKIEPSESFNY